MAELVGRDGELAMIKAALTSARAGNGRMLLISGDAGIGKTRLADEALRVARAEGIATIEGRAYSLHAGLAYAPIVEALRPYLAGHASGLVHLARLFADPSLPPAPSLGDPELEKTQMFDAVGQLLGRIAAERPVLWLVDDLHWSDKGTLQLLAFLFRLVETMPVVLLATYRTSEVAGPLLDLVAAVRRNEPKAELALGPLADGEVVRLAKGLLADEPSAQLLRDVTHRARGVPLFVTALLSGGAREGRVLPIVVRDLVLGRLTKLADAELWLVQIIAVAGESATEAVIEQVWHHDDLPAAVRRLRDTGLIAERDSGYGVAHPLYAEVAYAELTYAERRGLHADLARALDRLNPDDVLALAPHYRAAAALLDPVRTTKVLATAGWRAQHVHAEEEAVQYLSAALEGARAHGSEDEVVLLLGSLGRAQLACGRPAEAENAWREAIQHDQQDVSRMRHLLTLTEGERGEHGVGLPADSATTPETALLSLVYPLRYQGPDEVRAAASHMLTFTGRSPAELTALHLGREQLALLDNDFATSLSEATLAREYGRQCESDGPSLGRRAARALVHAMCLSGDVTGALTRARSDCARYYTTFGMPSSRCAAWLDLAMVLALQGFLPQALTELDAAVELGRQSDSALSRARLLAYRAYLEAESGRLREATASLADARATYTTHEATLTVLFALAATKIALNAHQPGTAPEPADDWDLFRQPVPGLLLLAHAGEAAVLSGRDADRFVERLRSAGRTAPLADALADRVSALQRKDVDLAWQAAERLAGQGATMLAAQAKVEWAELGGNEPRDVLRDCYTVFQEGDAAWWMDRTRILARAHGLSMGLSRVDGPLTKREWQVVRLVGEGLSNADIAARLFLGQRTVETHLRNSYAKLGLSGRVALAQWAAAH